ncbi:hypothetical protein MAR_020625, partial [Mya arenaria]
KLEAFNQCAQFKFIDQTISHSTHCLGLSDYLRFCDVIVAGQNTFGSDWEKRHHQSSKLSLC